MVELLLILAIAGICLFVFMLREAFRNYVKEEEISFLNFPDDVAPLKIFFISDIHKRKISQKIINHVKGKAKIVIIGGDLLEKDVPFDRVGKNLDMLLEIAPVYFVWGNNDYEVDADYLKNLFREKGVIELVNNAFVLASGKEKVINLIGVDDASTNQSYLSQAMKHVTPADFNILISHNPRMVKEIKKKDGIDFVISGHTHGGQIRLFGWGLYKKGRLERKSETTLLVSNGYGTTALPLRLGARAETHLITIGK
ncbi:metallophosphoesterase [Bacillus seohaeanensis]|uniref:Metallophosphoesterase n=1 Tax=Bacillus seohaeanensis TaxID=284580 RepID=A0ABW5RLL9_9BACI